MRDRLFLLLLPIVKLLELRLLLFLVGVKVPDDNPDIESLPVCGVVGRDRDLRLDLLSDPGAELLSWLNFAAIDGNSCGGKWISLVLNMVLCLCE